MKFRKTIIGEIIVGSLAMVLGVIFLMALAQPVANTAITSSTANWSGYQSAAGIVALVPLFVAVLVIILSASVAIGFLRSVGIM